MVLLRLIVKNTFRHKRRIGLTILGIIVAVLAFGMLQTLVNAWDEGANLQRPIDTRARTCPPISPICTFTGSYSMTRFARFRRVAPDRSGPSSSTSIGRRTWRRSPKAIFFACAMGVVGGFLLSVRAARMTIVDALCA